MSSAVADPYPFSPARFVDDESSLARLIEFPDVENDGLNVVYCTMHVFATGKTRDNHCFSSNSVDGRFYNSIHAAVPKAKLVPAKVDGEAQSVLLNYRVAFLKQDDAKSIGVYLNWGNDIKKYGANYEAPQKYADTTVYPSNCRLYENWVTMTIGADGNLMSEIEFRFQKRMYWKLCNSAIQHQHERAKYIPGHHEGKPVESTLEEAWGYYDHMKLE
jgi:hypothetical protein